MSGGLCVCVKIQRVYKFLSKTVRIETDAEIDISKKVRIDSGKQQIAPKSVSSLMQFTVCSMQCTLCSSYPKSSPMVEERQD
jgi:hypothetical protein